MARSKEPSRKCKQCLHIDRISYSLDRKRVCYKIGEMLGDILAGKEVKEESNATKCVFFEINPSYSSIPKIRR